MPGPREADGGAFVASLSALGEPWRRHPFLLEGAGRWSVARSWVDPGGVLLDTALASGARAIVGVGAAGAVASLLVAVLRERPPPTLVTVPRGVSDLVTGGVADAGLRRTLEWDWLLTQRAPDAQREEDLVVPLLTEQDRAQVAELLAVAYPSGWKVGRDRPDQHWWGVRDEGGRLVGSAGVRRLGPAGPARLGGIATHPAVRRRGIASALTARATREALAAGAPWVSLAIRRDNAAARALYLGLGFDVRAELETLRAA